MSDLHSLRRFLSAQRLTIGLVAVIGALIILATSWYWNYSQDDVYITYRYARNLATGYGLVFNPGEQVLGTTTPLFALLMAGVYLATPDLVHAGNAISAMSLFGVVCLTFAIGYHIGGLWLGGGAALMLALNPLFAVSFGMETLTYTLLLMSAFWFAYRQQQAIAGICVGLLAVTRADGILVVPVLVGASWLVNRRIPWVGLACASAITFGWYGYAWFAYGSPLPQTYDAKAEVLAGTLFLSEGLGWFRRLYLEGSPLYALALPLWIIGAVASWRRLNWLSALVAWSLLYVAGYTALNVSAFWYYAPLLPAVVLTIGYGAMVVWQRLGRLVSRPIILRGLATFMLAGLLMGQIRVAYAYSHTPERIETYRLVGEWLASNTPPESRVLVGDLGVVGWYSDRYMLDVPGLVVPGMYSHSELYAILKYRPDYIVATQYWTWTALPSVPWRLLDYRPVVQISTPGDLEFSPMTIYQRRYPLPEAGPAIQWQGWTARFGIPSWQPVWGDVAPVIIWAEAPAGSDTQFRWQLCARALDGKSQSGTYQYFFGGQYPAPLTLGPEEVLDVVWVNVPAPNQIAEVLLGESCIAPYAHIGTLTPNARQERAELDWSFGHLVRLMSWALDDRTYWSGGAIDVRLDWKMLSDTDGDKSVFVHLINAANELVAQQDGWPGGAPASATLPGMLVTDTRTIQLPPDLPAGNYHMFVGVYDPATGVREQLPDGADGVVLPVAIEVSWPGGTGLP